MATTSACAGSSEPRADDTRLVVRVSSGSSEARYRISCDPPAGNVPRPQALCVLLREHSEVMLRPPGRRQTCIGGFETVRLHVRGRFAGSAVDADVSACAGNPEGERLWLRELPPLPRRR